MFFTLNVLVVGLVGVVAFGIGFISGQIHEAENFIKAEDAFLADLEAQYAEDNKEDLA